MASRLLQLVAPKTTTATTSPLTAGSRLSMALSEISTPTVIPKTPKLVELFPSTLETLSDLQVDPLSLLQDPRKSLRTAWDSLKTTITESAPKIRTLFPAVGITGISGEGAGTPSEFVGEKLESTAALGHIAFSPITAFFEGANEVPVLGSVSRLISLPFIAVGEAGAKIGQEFVDLLPIPDDAKDNIKQGVEEVFALAGQITLGKISHVGSKKRGELKTKFGEKDAQTIINKVDELVGQAKEPIPLNVKDIPLEAKMGDVAEIARQRGLEVPEFGLEAKEIVPAKKFVEVPREQLPVRTPQAEKGVSALEARMKGVLETENIKAAKAEAEAKGLDVSVYDKMSKPEQLKLAAEYVEKTSQREVLEVLKGERPVPKGILQNAIMLALEAKSLRDRNIDLAIKLASLRSTRMGQEISILTEVEGTSPVAGMSEIIRARRDAATSKIKRGKTFTEKKGETVKEISVETTKLQLKMSEVSKILKDITC